MANVSDLRTPRTRQQVFHVNDFVSFTNGPWVYGCSAARKLWSSPAILGQSLVQNDPGFTSLDSCGSILDQACNFPEKAIISRVTLAI